MRCPSCGEELPDGTAICDRCDHIIDKSFLGDGYTDEIGADSLDSTGETLDERSDRQARVDTQNAPPPNPSRRRRSPRTADPPEPAGYTYDRAVTSRKKIRSAQDTPVEDSSVTDESLSVEASRVASDVESFLKKLGRAFKLLGTHDKLSVGGAVGMFLFTFFPWVSVSETGGLIGLEVDGWFILLLASAIVAIVYVRHQEQWQDKEKFLIYGQVGVAAISILFLLAKMSSLSKLKVVSKELGEQTVVSTSIEGGIILCFLATLAVLAGALLLLREKVLKK